MNDVPMDRQAMAAEDEAGDRSWRLIGRELEWGAEMVVEWGVEYARPSSRSVTVYGTSEDDREKARQLAARWATYPGEPGVTVKVVARRILYGPWGERGE